MDNANSLGGILQDIGTEGVFVHCASGNRVGSLVSIYSHTHQGLSVEDAIKEGKKWGLTSLESTVRAALEK